MFPVLDMNNEQINNLFLSQPDGSLGYGHVEDMRMGFDFEAFFADLDGNPDMGMGFLAPEGALI
jgi:hypothetical protein